MKYTFEVIRSTESGKGGFINTLQTETVKTVLGVKKTTKHIYNLKTDEAIEVGSKHELDLADFEVKVYPNQYVNSQGVTVTGENKWLHEKLV